MAGGAYESIRNINDNEFRVGSRAREALESFEVLVAADEVLGGLKLRRELERIRRI